MLRSFFKFIGWTIGVIAILICLLLVYVKIVSSVEVPKHGQSSLSDLSVVRPDSTLYLLGNNWFRHSESGLYEVYVEGDPYERGVAYGRLTHDLVFYQEKVFTDQLKQLVPSSFYRQFLRAGIGWFNRDLDDYIPEENKLEICGVSESTSPEFEFIAPAYQRIMNYHAAHDIGHALQNMSLVGCTSFGAWADASEDSSLIIGRNFDFYLGDDFAKDKIIAFFRPTSGYPFMMVTFGGMTGVLSGMNKEGLTVTLNAAKSEITTSSATPVSIVAREILQYASTIEEAYAIAQQRSTFVAETFLIGSAKDHMAAIIEKSPTACELVYSDKNSIVCTNHFQGAILGNTPLNIEHKRTSASVYRYHRVEELIAVNGKLSVTKTAAILRDQKGLNNTDIGLGNEKAICQLVAHHGIIFQPERKRVWISCAPWQLGKMVCYDLEEVFTQQMTADHEIYSSSLTIPADSFIQTTPYSDYLKYSPYRFPFQKHKDVDPDSLVSWNPNSYQSHLISGDIYFQRKNYSKAAGEYNLGLTKEVATEQEREYMKKKLAECNEYAK